MRTMFQGRLSHCTCVHTQANIQIEVRWHVTAKQSRDLCSWQVAAETSTAGGKAQQGFGRKVCKSIGAISERATHALHVLQEFRVIIGGR